MDTKLEEFKTELQALLDKHGYVLFAMPTYYQNKAGDWNSGAEVKIMPTPKESTPSPIVVSE